MNTVGLTPAESPAAAAAAATPCRKISNRERPEMSKARVLDVGNCNPDHGRIRALLVNNFDVVIDRVMFVDEARAALARQHYALVLVNRLIFEDGSDGLPLVAHIRAEPALAAVPVMMISNFPEAQARAVAAGASPGFGKAALDAPETLDRLAAFLPRKAAKRVG